MGAPLPQSRNPIWQIYRAVRSSAARRYLAELAADPEARQNDLIKRAGLKDTFASKSHRLSAWRRDYAGFMQLEDALTHDPEVAASFLATLSLPKSVAHLAAQVAGGATPGAKDAAARAIISVASEARQKVLGRKPNWSAPPASGKAHEAQNEPDELDLLLRAPATNTNEA